MKKDFNMKEENRYYQPTIEEFCVGFECEIETSWGYSKGEWPEVLKLDTLSGFEKDIIKATKMAGFRVKLLDSQDIIDCGFGNKRKSVWDWYELDKQFRMRSGHHISRIKLIHDRNNEFLEVTDGDICPNIKIWGDFCGTDECLFEGTIKNKHELKTILKMIGVL